MPSNDLSKYNIYGLIEATNLALKIHGRELSKENYVTHDWTVINKEGIIKLFHCQRCSLLCGLTQSDNTLRILSTTDLSCYDVKLSNILK